MKRSLFVLLVLVLCQTALQAGDRRRSSGSDYFFRPSRSIFNFRPDYYFSGFYGRPGYSRHRYGSPYFGNRRYSGSYFPNYPTPYGAALIRPRTDGIYRMVLSTPPHSEVIRANTADLVFNVVPERALIYVDDRLIGSARDFASERERFPLVQGDHEVRIEFPGYKAFEAKMQIVPNRTLHLDIELERNR